MDKTLKKLVFALLIVVAVVSVGLSAVSAAGYFQRTDETSDTAFVPRMGSFGCLDEDDLSYEFLYAHLSPDNQAVLDQMYADRLAQYDFSTMTTSEQTDTVNAIKTELAQYIIDNDLATYWYYPAR